MANNLLDIQEDSTNRAPVGELMHYHPSEAGDVQSSRKETVDRMKAGQVDIYYIAGDSVWDSLQSMCPHSSSGSLAYVLYANLLYYFNYDNGAELRFAAAMQLCMSSVTFAAL